MKPSQLFPSGRSQVSPRGGKDRVEYSRVIGSSGRDNLIIIYH